MIFMDIKEIRRAKLRELVARFGTLKRLAYEIAPRDKYLDRYLSQILNETRGMGDRLARKIEDSVGEERGWMDRMASSSRQNNELLQIWSQFPAEEQLRILEELRIRLRVLKDKSVIRESVAMTRGRQTRTPS